MISYLSNPLPSLFFLLQPLPLGTQTLWGRKLRGERLSVLDGVFPCLGVGPPLNPQECSQVARAWRSQHFFGAPASFSAVLANKYLQH